MDNVKFSAEGGKLNIILAGHVDSVNAPSLEKEIMGKLGQVDAKKVLIDCSALDYISSAGLRVILRVKKTVRDTSLINVKNDVYEIFEVTGFTEMMDVQKAYREIDVEGCEVIGQGANGKVYRIDPETIVKVYLDPDSLDDIHRERELARTAFVLGVPTAIPYDVVRVKSGGYGSVFELLNAKSLAKLVSTGEMSVAEVTKLSVDLLKIIHGTVVRPEQLPDMKSVARSWALFLKDYLPADKYAKLQALFDEVPEDLHMMHGDYHLKNVMLQNGECLLIDMDTICRGNPIFEFGSIYNAYQGFGLVDREAVRRFLNIGCEEANEIWKTTLKLYFDNKTPEEILQIEKKAMLVGVTRLMRRAIRRKEDTVNVYKELLLKLLDEVDTLL